MKTGKDNYVMGIASSPQKEADMIAKELISKQLAACVQIIGPVTSFYHWEGKMQKDSEVLLFIKTKEKLIKEIENMFKEKHPYEIPELIFFSFSKALSSYLKWIDKSVKQIG